MPTPEPKQPIAVPDLPAPPPEIDRSKRYDLYCLRWGNQMAVYRNVLIKGTRSLLAASNRFDTLGNYLEVEQANGETFFIGRHVILAFCEHGASLNFETIE
jgi:hypothetical protein